MIYFIFIYLFQIYADELLEQIIRLFMTFKTQNERNVIRTIPCMCVFLFFVFYLFITIHTPMRCP